MLQYLELYVNFHDYKGITLQRLLNIKKLDKRGWE